MEQGEFWEIFKDPRAVDAVDVGKEDEAMSCCVQFADGFPHEWVGRENVAPSMVEFLDSGGGVQGFYGPVGVVIGADLAGFEFVFAGE